MDPANKKTLTSRLNRISGQISGIQRMVEEDRYCVDILTQIAATRAALDTAGVELLTTHLRTCVIGHAKSSAHSQSRSMTEKDLIAEVETVLKRFLK